MNPKSLYRIIIGLGNPGDAYAPTYHNVGSAFVLYLKQKDAASEWRDSKLFQSASCRAVTLVLPKTFMNESGKAVTATLQKFRVQPKDILVVHDDHDLKVGSYKIAEPGTGSAGHNGVQSIIDAIGNTFPRLRIGISKTPDGPSRMKAENVVLSKITNADQKILNEVFKKILTENSITNCGYPSDR